MNLVMGGPIIRFFQIRILKQISQIHKFGFKILSFSQIVCMVAKLFIVAELSQIDISLDLFQNTLLIESMMVLGDLVTKLANRGHFDGAGPI